MTTVIARCPMHRPGLVIRPLGGDGRYVVKDPHSGAYFELGEEEHFLLQQLDGEQDAGDVCRAFGERFGEPLSADDLDGFVAMAAKQGLLRDGETERRSDGEQNPRNNSVAPPPSISPSLRPSVSKPRQSLLYWRRNIFDPDRFFTRLAPKIPFFWTPAFLFVSAACIALATLIVWTGRHELAGSLRSSLRWETAVLVWLTLLAVTLLHESAHGLTCKHYGGEVHEIGFLLMYFMPCFYCNVSDAWLFPEKSKRLWVTFAGGYFELFLWALAVFVWRVTVPGSLINGLAFVVLSVCGVQTLFNFNPLLKLDGYYLLSDWLEVPNLRQRSFERFKAHARRLLWGGAGPAPHRRGRVLTLFGLVSWSFSVFFLCGMCLALMHWATHSVWGIAGMIGVGLLTVASLRGLFSGFLAGEVKTMLRSRPLRMVVWIGTLGLLVAGACLIEVEDRATGPFTLRARTHADVPAPIAGVLRLAYVEEGDCVPEGMVLFRVEVPELAPKLGRKRAERDEAAARLAQLETGTRPEEITAGRQRVERALGARDLAAAHLERTRSAHVAESQRLDQEIVLARAELRAAESALQSARGLREQQALSAAQYEAAAAEADVRAAQVEQALADRRAHDAAGVLVAEQELAGRERELGEAQSALTLLEAGTRPEEITAQRARLRQIEADVEELEAIERKQTVIAPTAGVVVTPHVADRIGRHFSQGEVICVLDDVEQLTAEIALSEDAVRRVSGGQSARLRPRGLTMETIATNVNHVAAAAAATIPGMAATGTLPSTVTIACDVPNPERRLRPGMTGYARIDTGRRSIAAIVQDRVLHYVRTEFWW